MSDKPKLASYNNRDLLRLLRQKYNVAIELLDKVLRLHPDEFSRLHLLKPIPHIENDYEKDYPAEILKITVQVQDWIVYLALDSSGREDVKKSKLYAVSNIYAYLNFAWMVSRMIDWTNIGEKDAN